MSIHTSFYILIYFVSFHLGVRNNLILNPSCNLGANYVVFLCYLPADL